VRVCRKYFYVYKKKKLCEKAHNLDLVSTRSSSSSGLFELSGLFLKVGGLAHVGPGGTVRNTRSSSKVLLLHSVLDGSSEKDALLT